MIALEEEYGDEELFALFSSQDYVRLSLAAGRAGDVSGAEDSLDSAIEVDGNNYEAYIWRGDIKRSHGQFSSAADDANAALGLIAVETVKLKEFRDRAVGVWAQFPLDRKLATLNDHRARAVRTRGVSLLRSGNYWGAALDGAQMSRDDPNDYEGFFVMGMAALELKQSEIARIHLTKAIGLTTDPEKKDAIRSVLMQLSE